MDRGYVDPGLGRKSGGRGQLGVLELEISLSCRGGVG